MKHIRLDGITRRDFVGGTLVGTGAALLSAYAPAFVRSARAQDLTDNWTGPGGIGDYAMSNGNTSAVVNAAHGLRDKKYESLLKLAPNNAENYDVVIIGGGFSGIAALRTLQEEAPDRKVLLLENHPIFGGEAKLNEFDVDGVRLYGAQGSNAVPLPDKYHRDMGYVPALWDQIKLPSAGEFQFAQLEGTEKDIRFAKDNYGGMMKWPDKYSFGYFYGTPKQGYTMSLNAQANDFTNTPLDENLRKQFSNILGNRIRTDYPDNIDQWLDTMTYGQYLRKELGASEELVRYIDPYFAAAVSGASCDVVSARAALEIRMPGMYQFLSGVTADAYYNKKITYVSFPGGNTQVLRHLLKDVMPKAITGQQTFEDIFGGKVLFNELDKSGQNVRLRLNSTVLNVRHKAHPGQKDRVEVIYLRDGQVQKVRAKSVISAAGQWVAKHYLDDMPDKIREAMNSFQYGPMLVVNIALRNWRFMEKAGVSGARWENGFGWFANIRQPMSIGDYSPPLHPGKPAILTMYVSLVEHPELSARAHTVFNRTQLFNMSYAEIESKIINQLSSMFSHYGFDPQQDVAGIVLNRWGHAYVAAAPGFYSASGNAKSSSDVLRQGYGQISIAHSDLAGAQYWYAGVTEGVRAARQAIDAAG